MELSDTGNSEEYDDFETEESSESDKEDPKEKKKLMGPRIVNINGMQIEIPEEEEVEDEKTNEVTFDDYMEMMTPENVKRWNLTPEQL